jgi:DNA processing protein
MQTLHPDFAQKILSPESFPPVVHGLDGFPDSLYLVGNPTALFAPLVSIVGTRNPTPYGLRACAHFSRELCKRGFGIVSGLAVGIDAAAHRACLRESCTTVAVVAHGLDTLYPAQNRALADEILQSNGAIVSEFCPGTPALKHHFPRRNRIISALSMATLIIEASTKSGSLITARFAVEQGRDVFVVPGPFDSVSFRGSHALLREGAKLVDSVEEILTEMQQLPLTLPLHKSSCNYPLEQMQFWQSCFERVSGRATLLELVELSNSSVPNVLEQMEWAERAGSVEKSGLQTWVWIGGAVRQSSDALR